MTKWKYIFLIFTIGCQLTGIIFLFINTEIAYKLFIGYGFALLVLIILFIIDRLIEKKEDERNDYCDY